MDRNYLPPAAEWWSFMPGILYLVGTPIGNLGDMSKRTAEILGSTDFIAAEDTRVSIKLLNHLGIKKHMISYFEHNKRERGEEIAARIEAGENCALVTDAGMPAISDPGEDIVALCAQRGIEVSVIPGPCAAICALAVSGLPSGRFCFEGFLSINKKSRREHLNAIVGEERTLIFYEAPHKLKATLSDLFAAFGDRRVALVRELTKLHEEVIRTTLSQAVNLYDENAPRGEFVLVIEGKEPTAPKELMSAEEVIELAQSFVIGFINEGMSHSEAVKRAALQVGANRSELYKRTLNN